MRSLPCGICLSEGFVLFYLTSSNPATLPGAQYAVPTELKDKKYVHLLQVVFADRAMEEHS